MNADGAQVRRFTDNDSFDGQQVAPDGKSIAFASDRDGDREIFVMNADGTQVRQLTDNDNDDGFRFRRGPGRQINRIHRQRWRYRDLRDER